MIDRLKDAYNIGGIKGMIFKVFEGISNVICMQSLYYNYYKMKYGKIIQSKNYKKELQIYEAGLEKKNFEHIENKIPVFVCWFQSFELAPDIVKACNRQLTNKLNNKFKIYHINKENYDLYTNIPDMIINKFNKGLITYTHFSDILRTNLLINHGGVWIDSTMLLTDSIPNEILESELFLFKFDYSIIKNRQLASSQFIYVKERNNEILVRVQIGLYHYWFNKIKLDNYFMYHYFFALAINTSNITRMSFNEIPYYPSSNNHILQNELLKIYSKDRFDYYLKLSFIHKLTYKLDIKKINKNSNYEYIISNY